MYRQTVTRLHRTAFVILLDQSGSMAAKVRFGSATMSKAEAVARLTNRLLFELTCRARREEGVRDYFDLAVIGYSGDGVLAALGGREGFIPVTSLEQMRPGLQRSTTMHRTPDGDTVAATLALPAWVSPRCVGSTPMYEALLAARELLEAWCTEPRNRASYPPTLFNITDGEASDADDSDILDLCARIRSLGTADGQALLLNIHLGSGEEQRPVIFPARRSELGGSRYAELLFDASSPMPAPYVGAIAALRGDSAPASYRGMGYNASVEAVIAMMNIGSLSQNVY